MRRNFVWVLSGMVAVATFRWLLMVLLARSGSPQLLGQYALAVSIATPPVLFSRMRLRSLQASQTRNDYRFGHYAALTLVTSTLVYGIVGLTVWLGHYDVVTAACILLVTAGLVFESGSELCYGYFQRSEKMRFIGVSMVLRSVVSILAAVAGLLMGLSLPALLAVLSGIALLLWCTYDLPRLRRLMQTGTRYGQADRDADRLAPVWDVSRLRALAITSFPLAAGSALGMLNLQIPRYVLEASSGLGQLGVYSAIATLLVPGNIVVLGMTQTTLPRLSRHLAAGEREECGRYVSWLLAASVCVGGAVLVALSVAGNRIISLIYTGEYAGYDQVLWLLTLAGATTYVGYCLVVVVVADRRFWTIALAQSAVCLVVTTGSLIWIRRHGIVGAAAMQLTCAVCTTVLWALVAGNILRSSKVSPVACAVGDGTS